MREISWRLSVWRVTGGRSVGSSNFYFDAKIAVDRLSVVIGAWRSLVSALVWGTRGRRFESARSDH